MKLQKDLREFVALLVSRGVDFVVIGGHAVAFHGYPRLTDDIDLLLRPTRENAQRVLDAIAEFGFGSIELTVDDFVAPDQVIQLGRIPNRVDLLTHVYGVTIDEIWQTRVEADLDGLRVMMIGKAELIRTKRATGRTQDIADAEKLEET